MGSKRVAAADSLRAETELHVEARSSVRVKYSLSYGNSFESLGNASSMHSNDHFLALAEQRAKRMEYPAARTRRRKPAGKKGPTLAKSARMGHH